MPSPRKLRAALNRAKDDQSLLQLDRVTRPVETINGFVLAVGTKWALLQCTMDGGFFDGHIAIRLDEISGIRNDAGFQSAFARTRPEWPPSAPREAAVPDLDSTFGMLATVLRPDELAGIERNNRRGAKWIGVPDELTKHWMYMWEVRPDATWHDRPTGYRLGSIVMVTINDHYQRALAATAGPHPLDPSSPPWGSLRGSKSGR